MKKLFRSFCVVMAFVVAFSSMSIFAFADEVLPEDASYVSGDADGNAIVNSSDALAIMNHSVGAAYIEDVVRRTAADVNKDGKINSTDALMVLSFKVGNISSFPRADYNLQTVAGSIKIDSYTGNIVDAKGLGLVGYGYDAKAGVFYATGEGWQREFGFNEAYDRAAALGSMPLDTIRIKFNYDDKEWMVQFWKGFYGFVFAGCEVGIYNRPANSVSTSTSYNCATPDYYQDITCKFTYGKQTFTRSTRTWWNTGFIPSVQIFPSTNIPNMKADVTMKFSDPGLYKAFISGVREVDTIFANYTGRGRGFAFVEGDNFKQLGNSTVWLSWQ